MPKITESAAAIQIVICTKCKTKNNVKVWSCVKNKTVTYFYPIGYKCSKCGCPTFKLD